jgi:hypothetical protein
VGGLGWIICPAGLRLHICELSRGSFLVISQNDMTLDVCVCVCVCVCVSVSVWTLSGCMSVCDFGYENMEVLLHTCLWHHI